MDFLWRISFLLLLLLSSLKGIAQTQAAFALPEGKKKMRIPIVKAGSLIILKTYLNKKGPFNFVLDSGVDPMVIVDPTIKDSLNLDYVRKVEIGGLGEQQDLVAFITPGIHVDIGPVEAKRLGAVILQQQYTNLSTYAGIPIHGLIGYDFFNSFTVKTSIQDGYIICSDKSIEQAKRRDIRIPISLERKKPYCKAEVTAKDGKKYALKLLIDSGGEHTLALETWQGRSFPLPDSIINGSLGMGLEGRVRGYFGRIKELSIRRLKIPDLLTSFPIYEDVGKKVNQAVARNGSLGSQLLQYYNVVFDYHRGYIALAPYQKVLPAIEYNMSDLEIVADGKRFNQYRVYKVSGDSAKDLKEGDVLVSIDSKPVSFLRLDEIYQILRSGDGKLIPISVRRNNRIYSTELRLKKKI
ncbi:PDZ/DHR/GLGF domain protein [Pseudopedobacter saltans DSM 12145]|uniref:PDZ/DHR/GLGF domain protein n=1 Tax=Pseudopedobacter saltans (strain ATCC 51119 / DSM 12145 / JCM 21818 / CCUG 39354 / LMG 10337 / NBRC 100064 / NCIMB 13643) TaxID=762903 RepID=F0S8D7_PSESL|nr:aspartyl protease family protein [Pseudopedobacter saltans]ADY53401.1 PDZ/DHR/GLGF domain protein [Pseudopedobacter saltans DSM 12145]